MKLELTKKLEDLDRAQDKMRYIQNKGKVDVIEKYLKGNCPISEANIKEKSLPSDKKETARTVSS